MLMNRPNVAVFGCGYWGKNLVRNFHALGCLALVADLSEPGRRTAHEIAPEVPVTDNFQSALDDQAISAVVIAAPAAVHYDLVKRSLEAGKDVFVEKPLCLDVRQAEELAEKAGAMRRVLMVGHLLQYHPYVEELLSLVAKGEIGRLQYITSNRLNLGKIRREENALWSFAPHDISVILAIAGNQLPERVICTGGAYLTGGVADTTLTALQFAGGIRAHIYVSWLNPFKEQKLTVVGSNGMLVFDDTRPWTEKLLLFRQPISWTNGQIPTAAKSQGESVCVNESEPLRQECCHFLECCTERRLPRTDAQEGLRVLQVLQAGQESLERNGEWVDPRHLKRAQPAKAYFVHSTAVADDGAEIGAGTKIWHFSHVMKGARIGERCVFGQNVNVDGGVMIGNNVKVQNNVSIYTGAVIEDDVFLGPSCVLTNVTNPRSQVNRHSLYEKTVFKRGCTIGANATVVCGVTIGRYAFVGAGAVVTKDVPDYALILGNPGRQHGWMSRHGHRLSSPDQDGVMLCPESGFRYNEPQPGQLKCLDCDEDEALPHFLRTGSKPYDAFRQKAK